MREGRGVTVGEAGDSVTGLRKSRVERGGRRVARLQDQQLRNGRRRRQQKRSLRDGRDVLFITREKHQLFDGASLTLAHQHENKRFKSNRDGAFFLYLRSKVCDTNLGETCAKVKLNK